jgi:hypothetical protein
VGQNAGHQIRLNPHAPQDFYNDLPDSLFASRVMVSVFHNDNDYENTIEVAELGLERTGKLESERGKLFPK